MPELPEPVRAVISKHERWAFGSIGSSPHDDSFEAELGAAIGALPVWVLMDMHCGDCGQIVGVFADQAAAEQAAAEKWGNLLGHVEHSIEQYTVQG